MVVTKRLRDVLCTVLPHLVRFFEREKDNKDATRQKVEKIYTEIIKPSFSIYLYFLRPQLEVLSDLNKQLWWKNRTVHETY
jgi:hypothetical protein